MTPVPSASTAADAPAFAGSARVYEQEYRIRYVDCAAGWQLGAQGLLRLFEELALLQSEALGVGRALYARVGVVWLLSRWDLRLHHAPPFGALLHLRTQPREYRRSLAQRIFEARLADGTLAAEARSEWVFVETARRRPARIDPAIIAAYGVLEESALPAFEEPGLPRSASEYELRIDVRPSDLDHNGHVNNVRYVDWAFDALPRTLIEGRRCTRLVSRYVREVLHPGTVISRADAEHREGVLSTTHMIEGASGEACRIVASWSDVELPSDGTVD